MDSTFYTIDEILPLLKNKIILFTIIDGKKKYIHYYKKLILVQDINSRYKLPFEEFKNLYFDAKFYIYEDNSNIEIDIEKDKEYYSWRQ